MAHGIDWFRWHHGSVADQKFILVAKRSGASVAEVIAVWACLLEAASTSDDRGNSGPVDYEALDCALGMRDGTAQAIHEAMVSRGVVAPNGQIVAWEKRQPKRERYDDASTERVRAFRERKRQTQPSDASQRNETPGNATERQETPRVEKSREEEIHNPSTPNGVAPHKVDAAPKSSKSKPVECPEDIDAQVWSDWQALRKAKKAPVTETVVSSARGEAIKAGMSLDAFLRVWCARGSQGLQAEWLKPEERNRGSPQRAPSAAALAMAQACPTLVAPHMRQAAEPLTEVFDVTPRRLDRSSF